MASAYKWKFQTKNRPEMSLIYEVNPQLCRQLCLIPWKWDDFKKGSSSPAVKSLCLTSKTKYLI